MSEALSDWPHKADILINPAKKKPLAIFGVVVVAMACFMVKGDDIGKYFKTKHENSVLLPKMSALADQGKAEAVVWMVKHGGYDLSDPVVAKVQAAAEAGHAESMYVYSVLLAFKKDDDGAKLWLERSAAQGYPDAVLNVSE